MPKANPTPEWTAFYRHVGADIRALRVAADLAQDQVGELFDYNKDAISKIERGVNPISLYDYLRLIRFLREVVPSDHPALALAARYGLTENEG